MKPDRFAVSVIWGEGPHYFLRYFSTYAKAQSAANTELNALMHRRVKRGAKPTVMVWEKRSEGLTAYTDDGPVNA